MILISSDQYDYSTNHIIDWLIFFKEKFIRINKNDDYKITFSESKLNLSFDGESIDLSKLTGYFYRRGKIQNKHDNNSMDHLNDVSNDHSKIIDEYINFILERKISIGKYSTVNINKLIVLEVAKEIGFAIPNSYIIDKKSDISFLYNFNSELITKNHSNNSFFECEDGILIAYTSVLDDDNYKKIPELFSPSLFQEKIEKKYEIRVFYLNEKMWSMAIISQIDSATKNDYRKMSDSIVRNVPYSLPIDIEKKIIKLMKQLNLDTGSIDLIVNKKNEYIFLEVNPIGQFGSVSFNCNYNIEKEIAKFLANEHA
ncbi:grasp-with-spasm system ATP-grasp peptide maturase [Chryseobacterium mucoviscidosis]|uniref:grasp-with-spasm system ATP-grasp peptide maturase n=1 Tax=Chryseobacterium mucoviscidosis TaxID=1945581 RepID=UPI0031DCD6CA